MSQPRRRRRRRRKPGSSSDQSAPSEQKQQKQQQSGQQQPAASAGRRRRRRGRPRGEGKRPASPKSSEDLVRNGPKQRPGTLTAPADGQTLEGIIGELQSHYGVPQYPQEYRITIKVADERDQRPDPPSTDDRKPDTGPKRNGPKREKAPSAPVLLRDGADASSSGNKKRRRGRRGRRGRGGPGGSNGTGGSNGSGSAPSSS